MSCDGSDSTILANKLCVVPITTLRSAPYDLPWGSSIYAKVKATNIVGTTEYSEAGNGAQIIMEPDAPINLADNAGITSMI